MQGEIEMGRKKSFVSNNSIEILNEENEEDMEICGFTEAADISGTLVASFNFNKETDVPIAPVPEQQVPAISETKVPFESRPVICDKLIDNRTLQHYYNYIFNDGGKQL